MKDRIQILGRDEYLTRSDIAIGWKMSRRAAERTFTEADRIDRQELKFRSEPSRVRKETVERITGKKCKDTLERIKKADSPQNRSAQD